MTHVPTSALVRQAAERGTGLAAFNAVSLEQAEGIAEGAEAAGVPVVLQLSQNAVRFHHGHVAPIAAAMTAVARCSAVVVAVHLYHVSDLGLARAAIDAGLTSLMFDAGALPYEENLELTTQVVAEFHARGVFVEAELGHVGGKSEPARSAHDHGVRTDPEQAARFVADTGVDALAVAVGTRHGMHDRSATVDLSLLARLRDRVPVPLVLHGSSGLPASGIRRAVRGGITKVNVGTALSRAFSAGFRASLLEAGEVGDVRPHLARARTGVADEVYVLAAAVTSNDRRSADS